MNDTRMSRYEYDVGKSNRRGEMMFRPQQQGLNEDLAWEYTAATQYLQHAAMLNGSEYYVMIDELKEHAHDEFSHAEILNDLIQYLGGVPTVEAAPVMTSMNNREMLMQDLQGEYDAINRYLQRIQQLESMGLYDSSERIRNIIVDEQEHANDLENVLGINQNTVPKSPYYY
ncbi:bacterioferritin [Pontibacillus sp. HMF3514]|uniref:ferritin-like domain-containing protein n=1 Tax=Pontibacillus sp. HMF3514 TaxID=2692425 RepID=UPI001F3EACFF|nr:ferritin-like domain-containing protein [Pontibacillus sp. HMF3514]